MVLGISCDTPAENLAFKDKFDFPYDLLSDEDVSVSIAWGAADGPDVKYPSRISYIVDAEGTIAKAYETVAPAEHPDQVLGDLG